MGNIRVSVAAATAVADYDLLQDTRLQQVPYTRVLETIKVTGSAAAGDTTIDLFVGEDYIGRFANTNTGEGNKDDEQELGVIVYPNEAIHAIVVDPPSTNPIILNIRYREI